MLLDQSVVRHLLGAEALQLHGASSTWINSHECEGTHFDERFLLDLAGNSFVGHVFAAVLLGVLTEGPLRQVSPAMDQQASLDLVAQLLGTP